MLKAVSKKEYEEISAEEVEMTFVTKKASEANILLNKTKKEIGEAENLLVVLKKQISENELILKELKEINSQEKNNIKSAEATLKEYENDIKKMIEEKETLSQSLQRDQERVAMGIQNNSKILSEDIEKTKEFIEKNKEEMSALKEETDSSRRILEIVTEQEKETREMEKDLSAGVQWFLSEIEKLKEQKELLFLEVSALQSTIDDKRAELSSKDPEIENLQRERESLLNDMEELQTKVEEKKYEKLSLVEWKEQLDDYAERIKEHYKKAGITINL